MSNKLYPLNEEYIIPITFKVTLKSISDYFSLSPEQLKDAAKDFEKEIEAFILNKISKEYYSEQNVSEYYDFYNFTIEPYE